MSASSLSSDDLRAPPKAQDFVMLPENFGKRFLLTIDTEEEFDWSKPFDRSNRSVTIGNAMLRGQDYFRAAGVRPLYLTDYPVIDDLRVGPMLAEWQAAGEADVGAHCHPWVNPPYDEAVSETNSFAGNLPDALERNKITRLRDRIIEVTERAPLCFRAGRYGGGPNTARILGDLDFLLDTSVRSRFDYSGVHGPDFSGLPVKPWRAGPDRSLVELPLSTAYAGAFAAIGDIMTPILTRGGLTSGLFSRFQLLQRIPLTPEGVSSVQAIRAIDALLWEGVRLFVFSFHSPTLCPGNTPYVRNGADLEQFYRWWDAVFDHLALRGITAVGQDDILAACRQG